MLLLLLTLDEAPTNNKQSLKLDIAPMPLWSNGIAVIKPLHPCLHGRTPLAAVCTRTEEFREEEV